MVEGRPSASRAFPCRHGCSGRWPYFSLTRSALLYSYLRTWSACSYPLCRHSTTGPRARQLNGDRRARQCDCEGRDWTARLLVARCYGSARQTMLRKYTRLHFWNVMATCSTSTSPLSPHVRRQNAAGAAATARAHQRRRRRAALRARPRGFRRRPQELAGSQSLRINVETLLEHLS